MVTSTNSLFFRYSLSVIIIMSTAGLISSCKDDEDKSPLPVLKTMEATDITPLSAKVSGVVESEGASAVVKRGFCWSLRPETTVSDNLSENAFGAGNFAQTLTGLQVNTKYYVRTYATNGSGTIYGNEINFQTKSYTVGDITVSGGIVFHDKGKYENGWRYLEAAPTDFPLYLKWGCSDDVGVTNSLVGDGKANTDLINKKCGSVFISGAQYCLSFTLNGYNDWFIPSVDELDLLYKNLHEKGQGNFQNTKYWSSTQWAQYEGVAKDFSTGIPVVNLKLNTFRIRAVRTF